MKGLLTFFLLLGFCGCGTLPHKRGWGEDAFTVEPLSFQRVGKAFINALTDPNTLVPLAGAAIFAIDDWDEKTSVWAVKHTPVFGSEKRAGDASDLLRSILRAETVATALLTPSGELPNEWALNKAKGATIEVATWAIADYSRSALQKAIGRTRPDGDDNGFPSGHATDAFVYNTLTSRNLDSISMPNEARVALKVTNTAIASGVAWARVEAERHFPADVLAGAAFGHFVSAFIHDAFLGLPERENFFQFLFVPEKEGGHVEVSIDF